MENLGFSEGKSNELGLYDFQMLFSQASGFNSTDFVDICKSLATYEVPGTCKGIKALRNSVQENWVISMIFN